MNSTLKAADEVKKLTTMFKALGEVVEVLDRVGSLEQAENEAQARIDKLNAEAGAIKAVVDGTAEEAERLVADAKAKAEEIVGEAQAAANGLVESARTQAGDVLVEVERSRLDATTALESLRADAAEVTAARDAAAADLVELEGKIAKAQEQITKILGG